MFGSLAVISLFTSVALAQGSIPSGISDNCSKFLNALNADKSLADCTSALITATAAYAPSGNATSSPEKVASALSNLSSSSVTDKCPDSLIGGKIADFYSACPAELTSNSNQDVLKIYDSLYSITPLKTAMCSKDDSGNYCATQAKLPASSGPISQLQKVLAVPASGTALSPNATTYRSTNLLFLFLQPSLSSGDLCNVCTRKVMNAYLNFEAKIPYAPGLGKSLLLFNQPDLYEGIQKTCGSTFLSDAGVLKAAGGLGGGSMPSGALPTIIGSNHVFIATGMGILTLATLAF